MLTVTLLVLMTVLGNNILVGLPQNVRMLHIAQLEDFTPGTTILQELLGTDTNRTRIITEAQGWLATNQNVPFIYFSQHYRDSPQSRPQIQHLM